MKQGLGWLAQPAATSPKMCALAKRRGMVDPELPGGMTQVRFLFSGVITEYSPNFNSDQLATFTGRLMITGQPTYSLVS